MTPFNNQLQVGKPALIIGCHHPENSWTIGKTVIVDGFIEKGNQASGDIANYYFGIAPELMCIVSGFESDQLYNGKGVYKARFLMPIPPLGDVYDQEKMDEMQNLKIYS